MLRKVRPYIADSLGHHHSQIAESPRHLETGSRKSKLLESPGDPELEEPLGGRGEIFPNRETGGWDKSGWALGSMIGFSVQGHLEQKVNISVAFSRFLGEWS